MLGGAIPLPHGGKAGMWETGIVDVTGNTCGTVATLTIPLGDSTQTPCNLEDKPRRNCTENSLGADDEMSSWMDGWMDDTIPRSLPPTYVRTAPPPTSPVSNPIYLSTYLPTEHANADRSSTTWTPHFGRLRMPLQMHYLLESATCHIVRGPFYGLSLSKPPSAGLFR